MTKKFKEKYENIKQEQELSDFSNYRTYDISDSVKHFLNRMKDSTDKKTNDVKFIVPPPAKDKDAKGRKRMPARLLPGEDEFSYDEVANNAEKTQVIEKVLRRCLFNENTTINDYFESNHIDRQEREEIINDVLEDAIDNVFDKFDENKHANSFKILPSTISSEVKKAVQAVKEDDKPQPPTP